VVTTVVVPRTDAGHLHGKIPAEVVAALFESLDSRDLVPLAQLHTHPGSARMSPIDRERPLVAIRGFLSIIVPNFAFTSADPETWNVYEYQSHQEWLLWTRTDIERRLIIDDSIVQVD
jgi:proteasome lid subunit RPN8/RPN11